MNLIVDEYLNQSGNLVVGIRENSLASAYKYTLTRVEAHMLRDELTRALCRDFDKVAASGVGNERGDGGEE